MGLLTGLLTAVAGPLISGIFGSRQTKQQNEFNEEAYEKQRADAIEDQQELLPRLRASAEAAGFNPLTALQNTGGGGFGQTGVTAAPKLASQSLIGGVLSGVADFAQSRYAEKREHELASERIEQINADRDLVNNRNRGTVASTVQKIKTQSLPSLGALTTAAPQVTLTMPQVGDRMATNPYPTHSGMEIDTRFVDAEHAEQRYGDIAQEVGGALNLAADLFQKGRQMGRGVTLPTLKINIGSAPKVNYGPPRRPKVHGKAYKPNQKQFMLENYPTVYD